MPPTIWTETSYTKFMERKAAFVAWKIVQPARSSLRTMPYRSSRAISILWKLTSRRMLTTWKRKILPGWWKICCLRIPTNSKAVNWSFRIRPFLREACANLSLRMMRTTVSLRWKIQLIWVFWKCSLPFKLWFEREEMIKMVFLVKFTIRTFSCKQSIVCERQAKAQVHRRIVRIWTTKHRSYRGHSSK